jgi:hypothetical protein
MSFENLAWSVSTALTRCYSARWTAIKADPLSSCHTSIAAIPSGFSPRRGGKDDSCGSSVGRSAGSGGGRMMAIGVHRPYFTGEDSLASNKPAHSAL